MFYCDEIYANHLTDGAATTIIKRYFTTLENFQEARNGDMSNCHFITDNHTAYTDIKKGMDDGKFFVVKNPIMNKTKKLILLNMSLISSLILFIT